MYLLQILAHPQGLLLVVPLVGYEHLGRLLLLAPLLPDDGGHVPPAEGLQARHHHLHGELRVVGGGEPVLQQAGARLQTRLEHVHLQQPHHHHHSYHGTSAQVAHLAVVVAQVGRQGSPVRPSLARV